MPLVLQHLTKKNYKRAPGINGLHTTQTCR